MSAVASSACVQALADQVEALSDSGTGTWSLRLDDLDPSDRRLLLQTHGRVLSVLRSRGHRTAATIIHGDDGAELITITVGTPTTT